MKLPFLITGRDPAGRMTSNVQAVNYDARYYANDKDYILGLIDEEAYGPNGNYTPDTGYEFPEEDSLAIPALTRYINGTSSSGALRWDPDNSRFMAASGQMYVSSDGASWTLHSTLPDQSLFNSVTTPTDLIATLVGSDQVYLVIGNNPGGDARVAYNYNEAGWSVVQPPNSNNSFANSIAFGNGVHVLVGGLTSFSGTNQLIWTAPAGSHHSWTGVMSYTQASAKPSWPRSFSKVAFGAGVFVALCWSANSTAWLLSSADGGTWTERHEVLDFQVDNTSGTLAYGEGVGFLSVRHNFTEVAISADGINWTTSNTGVILDDSLEAGTNIRAVELTWSVAHQLWFLITREEDSQTFERIRMYWSEDGILWNQSNTDLGVSVGPNSLAINAAGTALLTYADPAV